MDHSSTAFTVAWAYRSGTGPGDRKKGDLLKVPGYLDLTGAAQASNSTQRVSLEPLPALLPPQGPQLGWGPWGLKSQKPGQVG